MRKQILLASLFAVMLFVFSCNNKHEHKQDGDYYTCPMHLTVRSETPGACPICNMTLVKVSSLKNKHGQHEGNLITLHSYQQMLAGIKVDTARMKHINAANTLLGTVAADEEKVKDVSTRVEGRIDKLYVRAQGEFVKAGSPLYQIYSEQLIAGAKEYLSLLQQKEKISGQHKLIDEFIHTAKARLLLLGLSEKQISMMENRKEVPATATFTADVSGYVTDLLVKEGIYVNEGAPLFRLTDLSSVWVEAQAYSNELSLLESKSEFNIITDAYPDEQFIGQVVFKNPSLEGDRKITLLRIRVTNPKGKLIPGMMVYVNLKSDEKKTLVIPKSALLLEKMKTVWVQTDSITFEQRMVETGVENKSEVEILSGVKEGESVLSSGAYLVNSEFILQKGAGQKHSH